MTESDLAEIEAELEITLPKAYRELMRARGEALRACGAFDDDFSSFFLDPREIALVNQGERQEDSGTAEAFPAWWKTFFLAGTNGAGDYYGLRLDNTPGVWMIGSDCGDRPTRVADSLAAFVDERMQEHHEDEERAARRHAIYQEEMAEEQRAMGERGDPKARQWLTAMSPSPMFEWLDQVDCQASARKLRLFGLACCRRIATLTKDEDCVRGIQLAEQMTNGTAPLPEVARLRDHLRSKYLAIVAREQQSAAGLWCVGAVQNLLQDDSDYLQGAGDADLLRVWNCAQSAVGDFSESTVQADLLREVLGNPFLPVLF